MKTPREFTPYFPPMVVTKQKLTSATGLGTVLESFDESPLKKLFALALPDRVSPRSGGAVRLGMIQLASFMQGHDCLADLEEFRTDPLLKEVMRGETVAPRTMGDFLRDFNEDHLLKMNGFLSAQAKSYRVQLERHLKKQFKPSLAPHLSIDSTPHEQTGSKIEGVAWNYKDQWCLDSQVIFDELGLAWDFILRSGNTKSGVGASDQIRRAFSSYKFTEEKYLSGDAAYCNQEVMTTCMGLGATFTLTANQGTTLWENHISEIEKWEPWVYPEDEKAAAAGGRALAEIEVGRFYWRPSWNDVLRLPVIVKRMKNTYEQLSFTESKYKYYGVVTNFSLIDRSLQSVFEFHNKRGNAENFIREEKYGYDLKHFPCLQLKANHAYGALALVAHNLLRWVAIHDNPKRPRFSKGIRRKFIHVPGKIVSHARSIVLKVSQKFYEEVNFLRQALELKPYPPIPGACFSG